MTLSKAPLLFTIENSLGSLELEVMTVIWKTDQITVREVLNFIVRKKIIAYTTIMTVMDNLYKKGFLTRQKLKKTYFYSPVMKENFVISTSLSKVFEDLNESYGERRIMYAAFSIGIVPIFKTYSRPIGYGVSLTILLVLFGLSVFDLLQNLSFSEVLDYLKFLTSDITSFFDNYQLYAAAFFENLPIINILTTFASLVLSVFLIRKLLKLLKLRIPLITNSEGVL